MGKCKRKKELKKLLPRLSEDVNNPIGTQEDRDRRWQKAMFLLLAYIARKM